MTGSFREKVPLLKEWSQLIFKVEQFKCLVDESYRCDCLCQNKSIPIYQMSIQQKKWQELDLFLVRYLCNCLHSQIHRIIFDIRLSLILTVELHRQDRFRNVNNYRLWYIAEICESEICWPHLKYTTYVRGDSMILTFHVPPLASGQGLCYIDGV